MNRTPLFFAIRFYAFFYTLYNLGRSIHLAYARGNFPKGGA